MRQMSDEFDPNAGLFGGDEPEKSPEELHMEYVFGKNPHRTSALTDLVYRALLASIEEDDLPEEAKRQLIFKMTANSVLDIMMEALDPALREEVMIAFDGYIGMCLVNMNFDVDLMSELSKAMMTVEQTEGESDEDFDRRLADMEEKWWTIPQPKLSMRNPEDAIREQMMKYGLNE